MKKIRTVVQTQQPPKISVGKWILILLGIFAILFITLFGIGILLIVIGSSNPITDGNIALIKISGVIVTDDGMSLFGKGTASSTKIVEKIKEATEDSAIKAIILEINSPGGSAVASDEIAQAVKAAQEKNKTVVAWIREVGASGGYWIASSADVIVANRMAITGSIGVIASYLDYSGLITKYNVSYQRLVAGKYKDIGSPFKPLSAEEEEFMQKRLDMLHDIFIDEVAHNRQLPVEQVRELANGLFYLGEEAKERGLVDILGGKEEAIKYIEEKEGITVKIREYKDKTSFLELLAQTFSQPKLVVMPPNTQTSGIQV